MSSGTQPKSSFSKTGALDTKATAFWVAGIALALGYAFFPALDFEREFVHGISTLSFVDLVFFQHGSGSTTFIHEFPLITSMVLLIPVMWLLFAWGMFRTRTCQYKSMVLMTVATAGLIFLCLAGFGALQERVGARGSLSAGSAWFALLIAIGALVRAQFAYINEFLANPLLEDPSEATISSAPRVGFGVALRDLHHRAWDYTTRTSRSGYWYGLLAFAVISLPLSFISGFLASLFNDRIAFIFVTFALPLFLGIIQTGIVVRRFHDIGRSGVLPVVLFGVSVGYTLSVGGFVAINGAFVVPHITANLMWVFVPFSFLWLGMFVFAGIRPGIDGPVAYSAH